MSKLFDLHDVAKRFQRGKESITIFEGLNLGIEEGEWCFLEPEHLALLVKAPVAGDA